MSSKLQHTLLNLEITPPQESWQAITSRLEEEYNTHETAVADKLTDWEIAPPPHAWNNILTGLQQQEPAKIIAFPFHKVAVAAVITGLLVLTGWYFFGSTTARNGVVQNETNMPVIDESSDGSAPSSAIADAAISPRASMPKKSVRSFTPHIYQPVTLPENNYMFASVGNNIPHAGTSNLRPITAARTPNVAAPPIRDAEGRIILDENLVTAADNNNYIIVTAPNGEQTRISSRFLQMLASMHADIKPSDYFDYFFLGENSSGWKIKFSAWRNKILQQASFIPTATNFLDIIELKELLQENQ